MGCPTLGQQYNIGEKPIVILYTYIKSPCRDNKTKPKHIINLYIQLVYFALYGIFCLRVQDYSNTVACRSIDKFNYCYFNEGNLRVLDDVKVLKIATTGP